MEQDQFESHMENIRKPHVSVEPPQALKLTILNVKQSARFGLWAIVIPSMFLLFVLMRYYLSMESSMLSTIEAFIIRVDRNPVTWFVQALLLLGLPILSIVINLLAIMHISWERTTRVVTFAVKVRWINLVILVVSTLIAGAFAVYLLVENF
jgi:hypothetical protein